MQHGFRPPRSSRTTQFTVLLPFLGRSAAYTYGQASAFLSVIQLAPYSSRHGSQNGRNGATELEAKMLLTAEIRAHLRRNADQSAIREIDHRPVVKFFTPDAQCTWLFTELAADQDTLFGLCDLGHGTPELGYASLAEIQSLRGPMRLLVERDRHFRANKSISAYAENARIFGRIVT